MRLPGERLKKSLRGLLQNIPMQKGKKMPRTKSENSDSKVEAEHHK
jgi:hypothetical protein